MKGISMPVTMQLWITRTTSRSTISRNSNMQRQRAANNIRHNHTCNFYRDLHRSASSAAVGTVGGQLGHDHQHQHSIFTRTRSVRSSCSSRMEIQTRTRTNLLLYDNDKNENSDNDNNAFVAIAGNENQNANTTIRPDPSLVDTRNAPSDYYGVSVASNNNSNNNTNNNYRVPLPPLPPAVVYENVITEEEAELICKEILDGRMKRKRYEKGHWDSVITLYKEVELHDFDTTIDFDNDNNNDSTRRLIATIFGRIRNLLEEQHLNTLYSSNNNSNGNNSPLSIRWLPCHAIDLKRDGALNPHVDSVRFSGYLVAGLSLLSSGIMRLKPAATGEDDDDDDNNSDDDNGTAAGAAITTTAKEGHVDLLLPPRSLYALTGVGRYGYSHELLPDASTFWLRNNNNDNDSDSDSKNDSNGESIVVRRDQRLSIIFRDAKPE